MAAGDCSTASEPVRAVETKGRNCRLVGGAIDRNFTCLDADYISTARDSHAVTSVAEGLQSRYGLHILSNATYREVQYMFSAELKKGSSEMLILSLLEA